MTLHQLLYPGIRPQQPPAGETARSHTRSKKLRRSRRAIGLVIVVAQNHDNVRHLRRLVHDPEISRETQNRVARQIQNRDKDNYENQKQQFGENSAALAFAFLQNTWYLICHLFGSSLRRLSAASSGSVPLK